MAGRVNHRGWIVLESVASSDGTLCVDFYQDPEAGFGFEHFRSDPEDAGRWTPIGGAGSRRFHDALDAAAAAREEVTWLTTDGRANQAWERWCDLLRAEAGNVESDGA